MEEIVQDMYITYWKRINCNMLLFTDTRLLKWSIADEPKYDYILVMGVGETIYVKINPLMNSEYAEFLKEEGYTILSNWVDGKYGDEKMNI